jgi:hypothetical protein
MLGIALIHMYPAPFTEQLHHFVAFEVLHVRDKPFRSQQSSNLPAVARVRFRCLIFSGQESGCDFP